MKIESSSPHPHADEKSGEIPQFKKNFWTTEQLNQKGTKYDLTSQKT